MSNASRDVEKSPAVAHEQVVASDSKAEQRRPWGLEWRSSIWFITLIVGIAITTDLLIYSMIVPIIPFRLQEMGYDGVSGLVGWLLFAYSGALVIFTPPIAYLSELYKNRKIPLLLGEAALIGSQVLLMEAPSFWVMVLARIAQGISACVIWVVGLALLCDTVPEKIVGKQLGLAMMGMSLGFLVGPPVSGALDQRFGFRGPFILGIIVTAVEFIGRLLVIERSAAEREDPSFTTLVAHNHKDAPRTPAYGAVQDEKRQEQEPHQPTTDVPNSTALGDAAGDVVETPTRVPSRAPSRATALAPRQQSVQLPILRLLITLFKSPRALSAVFLSLSYGIMISSIEPVLPLYLQSEYGLNVSKVGLVYIAAVVPSFISSPVAGWYADRGGAIVSTLVCLVGALPFWGVIIVQVNLAYFIAMFACLNLFMTGTISPVTAEFAAVTRSLDGVGYGHVYGAFNVAYGLGSALGPVIGGQLYDHVESSKGWLALCVFNAALVVVSVAVTVLWYGETTAVQRLMRVLRRRRLTQKDSGNAGPAEAQASA
ncbi:MFS general substrate transporter [Trametes elegans]|nr:MFS general substrate transporter [Trametes elegans]